MMRLPRLLVCLMLAAAPAAAQNLRIGMQAPPSTLDPHWLLNLANTGALRNMYDALVRRDAAMAIQPALAESWRVVDDTTWEFKLRPGVTFHDGSPLTSDDIAATFRRVPNVPGNPNPYTVYLFGVTAVEPIDNLTFRVKTSGPLPILPVNLAQIMVVSAKYADKGNPEFNSGEAAVGTGPFALGSWSTNAPLVMRRNERYWRGEPAAERVILHIQGDTTERFARLLEGNLDVAPLDPSQLTSVQASPSINVFSANVDGYDFLALNLANPENPQPGTDEAGNRLVQEPHPVLGDPNVRLAIARAIDYVRAIRHGIDPEGKPLPGQYKVGPWECPYHHGRMCLELLARLPA